MNTDQILSLIRGLLILCGPLGAYLIAHGMTAENLTTLVSLLIVAAGSVPPLIAFIWGMFAHTDAAKLEAVSDLPDVKAIVSVDRPNPLSAVAKAAFDPDFPKVVTEKQ